MAATGDPESLPPASGGVGCRSLQHTAHIGQQPVPLAVETGKHGAPQIGQLLPKGATVK